MPPLVSAIIPAYNREKTITRSVLSALNQSYTNLEVIVVDDGSTDATIEALRPLRDRIEIIEQPNGGPSAARNAGAAKAHGSIIAFLDSDDEWLPDKIDRQVRMMESAGESMPCCICNAAYPRHDGMNTSTSFELAGLSIPFRNAIWENPNEVLPTTFVLFNQVAAIRRNAFERVGGFNANLRLMEDYEISLRLATLGEWGVIRDPLVRKNEDTVGIGVSAMRDSLKHLAAQEFVFQTILSNPELNQPTIRLPIAAALKRIGRQRLAHAWLLRDSIALRFIARCGLAADRIHHAARRRMPGFPRPRFQRFD